MCGEVCQSRRIELRYSGVAGAVFFISDCKFFPFMEGQICGKDSCGYQDYLDSIDMYGVYHI